MSTLVESQSNAKMKFRRAYWPTTALAKAVGFKDEMMEVHLTDGRIVSAECVNGFWTLVAKV